MKRKLLGAASVALTAAMLAMPSAASAQQIDLRGIEEAVSCGPGVIGCVQDIIDSGQYFIDYGAEAARKGVATACTIVFGRSCGF